MTAILTEETLCLCGQPYNGTMYECEHCGSVVCERCHEHGMCWDCPPNLSLDDTPHRSVVLVLPNPECEILEGLVLWAEPGSDGDPLVFSVQKPLEANPETLLRGELSVRMATPPSQEAMAYG